jgi:hypothetical protein
MKTNENEPYWECDDCHVVKPLDDFCSPGHTPGGSSWGYDIDSFVCAECALQNHEAHQEELYQDMKAEMAAEDDVSKLLLWIPSLPVALVQGKARNYLVNYEARTCTCSDQARGKNQDCQHLAHVVGLVPCRAATEPHQNEWGLCL